MTDSGSTAVREQRAAGRTVVNPTIDRLGAYSWRLIGIGIVGLAAVWLATRLWVILLALGVAVLLSRALDPVAAPLRRRGWRPGLVAATVMLGFGLSLAGILAALVPPIASEFEDLGPTVEESLDDLERWLVEDSPFDLSHEDVQDFREQLDDRVERLLSDSGTSVVSTTLVVFEVITAVLLAAITAFFMLKDGGRFGRWAVSWLPADRRAMGNRLGGRAWHTLGGYLRGSALLGLLEGTVIGLTLWIAGASLVLPVAVITFFAAFVPFVGAIVAGVIAVLVALVTAGFGGAVAVLVVAVVVQQLDNDLLAPVVFGRSLDLHPLVVLFSITAGSALMGLAGAFFAVPVTAVLINVLAEARLVSTEAETETETTAAGAPPTAEP